MIDYNKLKIAHELAHKFIKEHGIQISVEVNILTNNEQYILEINHSSDFYELYDNLDELICKLQELTQPVKPKYKVGQEVWALLGDNKHYKKQILSRNFDINPPVYGYCYDIFDLDGCTLPMYERELYHTREALIEAQIEYWKGLSAITDGHTPVVCQHESDGMFHYYLEDNHTQTLVFHVKPDSILDRWKPTYNCKKCGEFYK